MTVPPGQTVALVGATGAGKSTFAKLVARFYDPTDGRVLVDGHDLRDVHARVAALADGDRAAGGVPVQRDGGDNIAFGRPDATAEDIETAARAVGAWDFIAALPDGLDTEVGERGVQLSAGQRQLIAFARALIADPRILVLDEATSNVDLHTEARIEDGLRRLLAGPHRDRHRAPAVDDPPGRAGSSCWTTGAIVEQGTHDELLAAGGRVRAVVPRLGRAGGGLSGRPGRRAHAAGATRSARGASTRRPPPRGRRRRASRTAS